VCYCSVAAATGVTAAALYADKFGGKDISGASDGDLEYGFSFGCCVAGFGATFLASLFFIPASRNANAQPKQ